MANQIQVMVVYDGAEYLLAGRGYDEVLAEIAAGVESPPAWLEVQAGQGRGTEAKLLIAPGIPIAVLHINAGDEVEREDAPTAPDLDVELGP